MLLALASGCTADPGTAFHVRGAVHDVTHIVAASGTDRVIAPVAPDGSFELALAPGRAWTVAFADTNAPHMLVGTLRANGLDTLAPVGPGELDLGAVAVAGGYATASIGWLDLIGALGLDQDTAVAMGETDNLALRYANPDLDGDGVIDPVGYRLDITGDVRPTAAGRALTIDDLVRGTRGDGFEYLGTGILAAVPGAAMQGSTVTFEQPFYGSQAGPSTPVVPANTAIGQPEVRIGALEGIPTMGVVARPYHDVPSGTYRVDIAGLPLTFERVMPPSDAQLRAGTHFATPVLRLVPTEPTCTTDCAIASVDFAWSDGAARAAKLDLLFAGGYIGLDLPAVTSGSLPWARKPARISGLTVADLADVSTSQLCYVGITYEDPFGMRMTSQIANPACP